MDHINNGPYQLFKKDPSQDIETIKGFEGQQVY